MRLTPDETQEKHIQTILDAGWSGGALVAEGMGRGKTLIATEVILRSNARVVLIVAPRNTMGSWRRTLVSQGFDGPIHRIATGKDFEAVTAALKAGERGVYLITNAFFRGPKFDWTKFKKLDIAVVDEIHKFANRQGVGFKKLQKLKPTFRIGMSGTPWGNRIENMWAVTRWVYPEWAGGSFWRWAENYLVQATKEIYVAGKVKEVVELTGELNNGEYVSTLPCFVRTPEAHPDIPPILRDQLWVELTPKQRRMYDTFERDAIIFVNDNPLVGAIPLSMRIRLRQLTLGSVTVSDTGEVGFSDDMQSAKFDALKEYLEDNDENIVIITESKRYAEIVAKRLGDSARLWAGGLKEHEQQALIDGFGVDFKYIVAVTAALDAGLDGLQTRCNTMVWMSRSEDPVMNEQTEGRLARRGSYKDHVVCIDIIAEDTYDESIINRNYIKSRQVAMTMGE